MRGRGARKTAALVVLLALLTAGSGAGAQEPPRREEISEELAALVRSKWETIKLETSNLPNDEWAGSYRAIGGPTFSTHLAWSPASGFMVWWENCSRPHLALVNYGNAVFTNGSLKLTPELPENSPSVYPVESEFIPVKWGEQHFLIPSDKMVNFAYAVNSTSAEQVESFLMKVEDYEKGRKGLPDVPRAYRKYLRTKPITAAVSGLGPEEEGTQKVILNVGRAEGVVQEMKFYLSRPRKIYMQVLVTGVEEHTSEALVILATFTDGRQGEAVEPQVGWKFTSRAPEDDSQYLP